MSFSANVKSELTAKELPKGCCARATAYGIACFCKYFDAKGLILHTESADVVQYVKNIFLRCGINGQIFVKGKEESKIFEYAIKENEEIDKLFEMFSHSKNSVSMHLLGQNFVCERCVSSFTSAAYLCAGTMSDPSKAYNLEIITPRRNVAIDFQNLLKGHDFNCGHILRKGSNVLYFKNSEQIEDMLTFMGAVKASLLIMDLKVYKDFRNKANRITNCETANIDKTVLASSSTLEAIDYLKKNNAFEVLPENIKFTAEKRVEFSDLSLKELALYFEPPLSKSGLSHRLKSIENAAEALKKRNSRDS